MLNVQEFFVQKEIKELGGLREIDQAINLIDEYVNTTYSYESKNIRLQEWNPDHGDMYEIVLAVFTICLGNQSLTYQSIAGMVASRINLPKKLDRVKTAAECIALISRTGLIDIERTGSGNYIMVSTQYELDKELPEEEKKRILYEAPELQEGSNRYHDDNTSLILGGRVKHHDGEICLDHINRMNAIEFKLNTELLRQYEEQPTFVLDTQKKKDQWEQFIKNSYRRYIETVRKHDNRFYLKHYYDSRGRTYAHGYHITTQGSSFKKAICQLANTELVEG